MDVPRLFGAARAALVGTALGIWFVALLALGAGLLARHAVALPLADVARAGPALGALRTPAERGEWLAVHVLQAECRCSQRIVDHLTSAPRPAGWSELVLWTGEGVPDPALESHGLRVLRVSRAELSRAGLEAAPMLVALDPRDRVVYAGGYTARKQGPVTEDARILRQVRSDAGGLPSLPVFGCAVSDRLRAVLARLPVPTA